MRTYVPVEMHPVAKVHGALRLAELGLTVGEIASVTGCARSTVRGWIAGSIPRASQAGVRCSRCGGAHEDPSNVAAEYVYLLGLYLGDGCIASHPRRVFRLRVVLDVRYPGIIEECRTAIRAVVPRNRIGLQPRGGGFVTSVAGSSMELWAYSQGWPCLIPQHGPGRKHDRRIVLDDWQERLVDEHPGRLLRGLIHSDGCRFVNTGRNWRHPRYSFSNRSEDIRRIFCEACDRLDLRWTLAPSTVYVSRVADVRRLDDFVGPKR